jgi:FkbM family methyltransferase
MSFVSYAQNFEDVLLWRALRDIENGRYIDIGAHDPVVDSVSLAFYNAGWRGMHVEPIPALASKLRAARPEEAVIEAAVTDARGPILLHELDGLTTGNPAVAELYAKAGHQARQTFVPTVRLDDLLQAIGTDVHWLKVDVEGMEGDVLRSWGDCPVRPWVLAIESTLPNTQEPQQHLWIEYVTGRDYEEVFFDGLNRYFLHSDHLDRRGYFSAPANLFDAYSVTGNHFSAKEIRAELEASTERVTEHEQTACELRSQLATSEKSLSEERSRANALESRIAAAEAGEAAAQADAAAASSALASALRNEADMARKLAHAAQQHASDLEAASRARNAAEAELRQKFETASQKLNEELTSLRASEAAARVEAARFEERSVALEQHRILMNELRAALSRADTLVRAARAEKAALWQRVGEAIGLYRHPASWVALLNWSPAELPLPTPDVSLTEEVKTDVNNSASWEARNPYLRANSLSELLAWHDVDFVRCAYVTVLGRQPDTEGEAFYVGLIRSGCSKTQVLWQLRHSDEGRRHDPGIAGLDRALGRARRARMRLIGGVFRFFNHEEGDTARDRRARATANEIAMVRAAQGAALNELRGLGSDVRTLRNLIEAVGATRSVGGSPIMQVGSESASARGLLDPVELDSARDPDEVIDTLKAAINSSREVVAFRSGRQSPQ